MAVADPRRQLTEYALGLPGTREDYPWNELVIKVGTKVRGIRLVQGVGDHDIDCKVDGVGPMQLKSSVVKKA